MANPILDIDDLLETPNDARFIAGVFNYCNRRCDRCSLSDRCRLYADEQRDLETSPDDTWATRVHRSLHRTVESDPTMVREGRRRRRHALSSRRVR